MADVTLVQIGIVFFAALLTSNIVLSNFLGLCSYFSLSGSLHTAFRMGLTVMVITFLSSLINFGIYQLILLPGAFLAEADLSFLTFLVFILVIAALVQSLEAVMEQFLPELAEQFGPFLALITVNCAIMGVNLFMIEPLLDFKLVQVMAYCLGSGSGWLLVICMMAAIRIKLEKSGNVPEPLKGMGINLLITGIMAMIFMGFSGMIDM